MKYVIECISTDEGWRYRVTLWRGRTAYTGRQTYALFQSAERAAKATGATPKEEAK